MMMDVWLMVVLLWWLIILYNYYSAHTTHTYCGNMVCIVQIAI